MHHGENLSGDPLLAEGFFKEFPGVLPVLLQKVGCNHFADHISSCSS